MSLITFDENQVQEFGPIPAGHYECFIVGAMVDKSTVKGTDLIEMKLKVRADVEQGSPGRVVFYKLYFTDKTQGMVQGFLKNLGTTQGQTFDSLQDVANFAKGKAILADVEIRKYEDKDGNPKETNDVKRTKPSQIGGTTTELEEKTSTGKQSGSTDPFAHTGTTLNISDDDLPF